MTVENEVVFPRAMKDIFPMAAQQLYIETYKKSWAITATAPSNQLSRESVAARDAWDAVKREFVEDSLTHKWHRAGEVSPETSNRNEKGSVMGSIKRLFKR